MENEKLTNLVKKAQSGDAGAMEELLRQSHTSVSYQCRKMLKNAQDAEDLTQEILVVVYTKLDTLQEPAAYWGWLNRITATRCMNALGRNHIDLQFAQDEQGHSVLDDMETLDERQVPDKALDNAETARMIDQIVSDLPEAQRMTTLLYYYDEMSVKQIAQVMSVPENTVKGRLNLARKAIKERVLTYEKQGVKLYSVSVLPMLWYFLRMAAELGQDSAAASAMAASILSGSTAAAGTGAVAVVGAAGKLLSKKVIAAIVAGVLAVGGMATAAVAIINGRNLQGGSALCIHEWADADCTAPQTCKKCGGTKGEALGHTWNEANCEAPKTCAVCAATEGDALGHTWNEATCDTAKTCSVCAKVEGEALGHAWVDANYQAPKTCSRCHATEGAPLTPDFETHGIKVINAEMGKEYDFVTCCYDDRSLKTVGKLKLSDYRTFASDETHEAADGYVWHAVTVNILFNDDNAWRYGMYLNRFFCDYYKCDPWGSSDWDTEIEDGTFFTVNYNGLDYTQCISQKNETGFLGWEDQTNTYLCEFYWRVPVGFDGYIQGFRDGSVEDTEGRYIYEFMDENTLFFRFPAA